MTGTQNPETPDPGTEEALAAVLAALRSRTDRIDPRELDRLWDRCSPITVDRLAGGRWRGFGFDTGHPMYDRLVESRWYGKDFTSPTDAQPLLRRGDDGEIFSDLETGRGAASLWMVEFRGESTATMVYDGLPVFDHFKSVDARTVLGIMNGKGTRAGGEHFYFGLERD